MSSGSTNLPTIPRSLWSEHPNYPEHALLLDSHESFRRLSQWMLINLAKVRDELQLARRKKRILQKIGGHYEDWMSAMRSHERYEEQKLYPFLAEYYETSFEHLVQTHAKLLEPSEIPARAFGALQWAELGSEVESLRQQIRASIVEYSEALIAHLHEEEDLIIPLLLSLPPEDFRAYEDGTYTPPRAETTKVEEWWAGASSELESEDSDDDLKF